MLECRSNPSDNCNPSSTIFRPAFHIFLLVFHHLKFRTVTTETDDAYNAQLNKIYKFTQNVDKLNN